MKTQQIVYGLVIVAIILSVTVLGNYLYTLYFIADAPEYNVQQSLPPSEIPAAASQQTGPPGSYESCKGKAVKDSCYFYIAGEKRDGVCYDIAGTLTCGPEFPEG